MDLANIPLFAMLRGRLGYLSERQRLISENVANSDTAGFAPRDLKPFAFDAQVQAARGASVQAVTQPGHMVAPGLHRSQAAGGAKPIKAAGSETTLDGNSVVLEEEMMKMSDARMNYDAAIGFYQKSMGLLRMAARAPGR
jgi:flagellar basal-body rod protein FlgB